MKQFPYVEDYLEVINGDRDPVTGKVHGLFDSTPPIINLARYDVNIIASMSSNTQTGNALTDRQAEIACKIILKYRKQLATHSISVDPVESPVFRIPLRTIDRRKLMTLVDNEICLKFPFETKLIDQVRDMTKDSQGHWRWSNAAKEWRLGLTETNLIAAIGIGRMNQFEIDPELLELEQRILDIEATPYEIKLIKSDSQLAITNMPQSLGDYIESELGGLNNDNALRLIDHASILGYSVDRVLEYTVTKDHPPRVFNLMLGNEHRFAPGTEDLTVFEDIIYYAELTNRWPIYVYEPDMSDKLYKGFVEKYFTPDQIYKSTDTKKQPEVEGKRVIFFNKYAAQWNLDMPLLISSAGMMHGGEKTMLLQRAKKVVYFAAQVYNNAKGRRS
jgi:hypothetical protein